MSAPEGRLDARPASEVGAAGAGVVHVLPLGVDVTVAAGETLMDAATRQGFLWPTVCHGDAECGVCWVCVEGGEAFTNPIDAAEQATLARGARASEPRARLACRLRVRGRVTVTKRGVRTPPSEASKR